MSAVSEPGDPDPVETREWLESIDSVLQGRRGRNAPISCSTAWSTTRAVPAPTCRSARTRPTSTPSRWASSRNIRAIASSSAASRRTSAGTRWRWSSQANRKSSEYGGHIASYASSATLYEVGFNHFWRAPSATHPGDMVFMQGHSSPGIYARAYLEGRLTEEQLQRFRQEVAGGGLSLLSASLADAGLLAVPDGVDGPRADDGASTRRASSATSSTAAWCRPPTARSGCFCGDGEMDEPESMGALTMPVREQLDNLVFVINCNLQRLDGPVRGNGKIIQELEAAFLGAGWNVIKVIWGSRWDPLLAQDTDGLLRQVMEAVRRRRIPELQGQGRRVHARAFLRQVSGAQGDGRQHVRRGDLAPESRRPRCAARSMRPTRRRCSTRAGRP